MKLYRTKRWAEADPQTTDSLNEDFQLLLETVISRVNFGASVSYSRRYRLPLTHLEGRAGGI